MELVPIRSITTECQLPYTYFNIASFVIFAVYAVYSFVKLRKIIGFNSKLLTSVIIVILTARVCAYIYLQYGTTYCNHFFSFSESDSTNSVNYYLNMTEMISLNKIHEYGSLINVVFMVI